eukprot:Skav209513  [mRNA]  locus=scaffold2767:237231:240430:+ [translate_table: standard]
MHTSVLCRLKGGHGTAQTIALTSQHLESPLCCWDVHGCQRSRGRLTKSYPGELLEIEKALLIILRFWCFGVTRLGVALFNRLKDLARILAVQLVAVPLSCFYSSCLRWISFSQVPNHTGSSNWSIVFQGFARRTDKGCLSCGQLQLQSAQL